VHRADGERTGWLDEHGGARTLIGTPLALRPDEEPTEALQARGLTAIDGRWWARLPEEVDATTDATAPRPDWRWEPVVLVEASPEACAIRLELAEPAQLRHHFRLPVPVGDLLRREPPP
jgi:hypothetical protein